MGHYNAANAFETELTASMGPLSLTASVTTTTGAPSSPCIMVIDPNDPAKREYILFDDTFTGTTFVTTGVVNRYLSGSAAGSGITHDVGAKVRHAFTKQDYDNIKAEIDKKIAKSGDTMTGQLTLSGDPVGNLNPATKQYVDAEITARTADVDAEEAARIAADNLRVLKAGDTMTGPLVLPSDPTLDLQASTKQYVDTFLGTYAELAASLSPVASGSEVAIEVATEIYDTAGLHNDPANWEIFSIPAALDGWLLQFYGQITFSVGTVGYRLARIRKNSGSYVGWNRAGAAGTMEIQVMSPVIQVATGDFFELTATHSQGSNLDIDAAGKTWFAAKVIGKL